MSAIHKCPHCQTVFATADGICPHCKKSICASTSEDENVRPKAEENKTTNAEPSMDEMLKAAQATAAETEAKYTKPKKVRYEIDEDESVCFWGWWCAGAFACGVMWLLCLIFENNYYLDWQQAIAALAFVPMLIYGVMLFKRSRKGFLWKLMFFIELFLTIITVTTPIRAESLLFTIHMIEGIIAAIVVWIAIKS